MTNELITFYNGYAETWFSFYWYWLMAGEIMGCFIIAGSIAVASSPTFVTQRVSIKTIAFLVAVLSGINTFLDPLGRAQAYGMGLTNVTNAMLEVQFSPPDDPKLQEKIEKVRSAAAEGLMNLRQKSVAQRPMTPSKPNQ